MSNQLRKTFKLQPAKGRIERMKLSEALKAMGLPIPMGPHHVPSYNLVNLDHWQRIDLFKRAKACWLAGCKLIQTQFVQNHEIAARWNALWQRVKVLFKKKGIEI